MKEHAKSAAITLAVVLVGIYVLRQVPTVGPLVDKMLMG
jgi:hypothetical protein